jgi:hypothetical protein
MATWPDTAELAKVLNIAPAEAVEDWETTLDRVLASAIAVTKSVVGHWDEDVDEPTDNQAQAALRQAEVIATRPDGTPNTNDPTFLRLLTGQRRRFGIA